MNLLVANWKAIRDEAAALRGAKVLPFTWAGKTLPQLVEMMAAHGPGWLPSTNDPARWLTWGLAMDGRFPLGDAQCPRTCELLSSLSGLRLALFSWFRPGFVIPIHTHPDMATDGVLTAHLGLLVPEHCALWIDSPSGGQFIAERPGKGFIFDGSRPHFAFNASRKDRVILYCDFSGPDVRGILTKRTAP